MKVAAGLLAAGILGIAIYRNAKNFFKPPQTTDQPLTHWVNNTDYDGVLVLSFVLFWFLFLFATKRVIPHPSS